MPRSAQTERELPPLGVLAGAGEFPRVLIEGARKAGRKIVCAGLRGAVDKSLADHTIAFKIFRVGALDAPIDFFLKHGVQEMVLTGQIKPASIYTLWPDPSARKVLSSLKQRNAHTIFGAVCDYITKRGITVLPSTTYMENALPPAGHLAGPACADDAAALRGMRAAQHIADLDIGQSIIMSADGSRALCVEAFKGTNECITASRQGAAEPKMLCKISKPEHDMRFDVPCIGPRTIELCHEAGVSQIILEAQRTFILERERVQQLCEAFNMSLLCREAPPALQNMNPPQVRSDKDYAFYLTQQLQLAGIGNCAIVCEGVIIAVGDTRENAELICLERAARYMKKLRIIRLIKWVFNCLLFRRRQKPAPMIMVCAQPPSATLLQAAQSAGIELHA